MIRLKKKFRKNGMEYNIIQVSPKRKYYLAEVKTDSGNIASVEIGRIHQGNERHVNFKEQPIDFPAKESIISNSDFGKDLYEGAWGNPHRHIPEEIFQRACISEK